ncbi:MAG TPA: FAD-binding oxidoreductase, partial [Gemmatimonadaceae bacterium]|nr:FAD-binding oxidoreductase [Gemmatimonadaceae bacterium]
ATRTPLVPRGAGSSMAGGAIGPGVVVDLSRRRSIGVVDVETRSVRVDPGALCGDVDAAARARGLRFPVAPSSAAFCTIGGMAATNAAGAPSLRHGAIRAWVRALDCVFDDGSRAELRRGAAPPGAAPAVARFLTDAPALRSEELEHPSMHFGVRKESSGYALGDWAQSGELVDLMVGSEGTLALFVGIELALTPAAPMTASLLGAFDSLEAAVEATTAARELGVSACELLDRTFLDVARAGGAVAVPAGAEAVLLVELEGEDVAHTRALAEEVAQAFRIAGASDVVVALDDASAHDLWALRHAASPILSRLDPQVRSMQFIEDGAVPPDRLPEYVRGVRDTLARHELRGVLFGHAGDGHVHVNPLVDVSRPDWRARVESVLDEVTGLVARLGGTLAGEHGDGRLRAPLLDRCWSQASLARFALVKGAFDPRGIFNPGVKVPLPRQRPLGDIKYDPTLPPLPIAARRALDRVERERGYAMDRLALLESSARGAPPTRPSGTAVSPPAVID